MRGVLCGAAALVLAMGACTDDSSSSSSTTTSTAPTPTFEGDGSPFCDAMLAVGQISGAQGAPPAEVLETNRQLAAHLDEAQVNTPADAPPDFEALIDDYRAAIAAIFDAEGDLDEAFRALEAAHPDVVARLGSSTSHEEAYAFLVERCGINPP